jgi:assimilatory nitrate reductase electron transfer subunit
VSHVLIIGNGPAAHRLVERLRHHGHEDMITVLGAERQRAYNRVLLASVLDRTLTPEAVTLPDLPPDVRVRLGVTATGIDRQRRLVHTDTGVVHRYDELVLATGSRPTLPDVPGLHHDGQPAEGVTTLRTLSDCERITDLTGDLGRIVVLGGGVLGVEAARGLAGHGYDVTLVHSQPYLMERQVDHTGGRLLADHLRRLGVDLQLGRQAAEYEPGRLVLDDGNVVESGMLVVCAGVTPEVTLARKADLTVHRGVVVDDRLSTDDPHIHAIGDCAEHAGSVSGLITPAWEQAETLAQRMVGADARYRGSRAVTRLKARGIDLAAIGSTEALNSLDADVELVTLSDPARGRYAKLALRDQRITAAVLLGFPQAIASVTQLHDRSEPAPSDRLGLLLGTAASTERAVSAELPDNAVVCRCNNVTKKALVHAWHDGAREISELATATRATTGCGSCTDDIRRLCGSLRSNSEPRSTPEMTEQEGAA